MYHQESAGGAKWKVEFKSDFGVDMTVGLRVHNVDLLACNVVY